ncbi:MAG: hypothetical protein CMH55_00560, partial [Myxococcales bacterium]|nr:hypothetical protein [Myxococcales bacterium]
MSARAGDRFADYLLLHKIAQGGMGEVFVARRSGPQGFVRHVVLKRMLPQYLDRPEYVEMFFAEARLASRLHHDRIVQVLEVGEWEGNYYLVMEHVRGVNLRQLLDAAQAAGKPVPPAAFCRAMAEAAEGLDYAHKATDHDGSPLQLVHRDINPSNLLIGWDGHLKIIDLGIAKSVLAQGRTQTGMLKGKYRYMSPEQSEGLDLDASSDLFALGLVVYEGLAGSHPFHREGLALTLAAIQSAAMPLLENPSLRDANKVLRRALAKAPEDRYESSASFAQALKTLAEGWDDPTDLTALLQDLFEEQIQLEKTLLSIQDPADLRRLAADQTRPLKLPTSLIEGLAGEPGWTGLLEGHGERSDNSTRVQVAGRPGEAAEAENSLQTDWIDPKPQRWSMAIAALPLLLGLGWLAFSIGFDGDSDALNTVAAPITPAGIVDAGKTRSVPLAKDVGAKPVRALVDGGGTTPGLPAARLAVTGMRSDLPAGGVPLERRGTFTLRAPGLRLKASYRRETAG